MDKPEIECVKVPNTHVDKYIYRPKKKPDEPKTDKFSNFWIPKFYDKQRANR